MSKKNTKLCGVCQSTFKDSDCIHAPGGGVVDDPVRPDYNLDDEATSHLSKGPSGLMGDLPAIYLNPPCSSVYVTYDQVIDYDVEQTIKYNRRNYDTDTMWSLNEPTKLFFRTEGVYLVTLAVRWNKTDDNSATGHMATFIRTSENQIVAVDAIRVPNGDLYAHQTTHAIVPARAEYFVESLAKAAVIDGDDEPMPMRITAERQSPIFTATYLRPLTGLNIPRF